MGYSIRTSSFRYTQWRRWIPISQVADWSNEGLVAVEFYNHTGDTMDKDPAQFENINLAGLPELAITESELRNTLENTVKTPSFSDSRCGSVGPPLPSTTPCTSASDETGCAQLYASRCSWFPGYGCQSSNFCGFLTKGYVKPNQKIGDPPIPPGSPGCALFSSTCIWKPARKGKPAYCAPVTVWPNQNSDD